MGKKKNLNENARNLIKRFFYGVLTIGSKDILRNMLGYFFGKHRGGTLDLFPKI